MAVSNGCKGQRRRRRRELNNKNLTNTQAAKTAKSRSKKSKAKTKTPKQLESSKPKKALKSKTVLVTSDGDDSEIECLNPYRQDKQIICLDSEDDDTELDASRCDHAVNQIDPTSAICFDESEINLADSLNPVASKSNHHSTNSHSELPTEISGFEDNTFDLYEKKMDERNQANNLVLYMEAAIQDDTSDEEAPEDEDDLLQEMWLVFYGPVSYAETQPRKRVLKSGKSGYQQPVASSNPLSQKLVPRALPRQTKHDRKNKQLKALGPNNNIMQNFLMKQPTSTTQEESDAAIDPNLNEATLEDTNLEKSIGKDETRKQLNDEQARYLAAPKASKSTSDAQRTEARSKRAQAQWDELNTAISSATAILYEKAKKDKKVKIPQSTIDNLKEFNTLRYQYIMDGTPLPTSAASLATARSSLRRHSKMVGPQKPKCGNYLAKLICKQAQHVITYREIPTNKGGNRKNHRSMLNNPQLKEALFKWAASQLPGVVTPLTFRSHVVNELLPNFGLDATLSRNAATRWMYKLGYRPQEHKKALYFDGHERPDVVQARSEYIKNYTMYRKRSRMYDLETFQLSSNVDPEHLNDMKETVFVYHDESTTHAKERPKSTWLLPGTSKIRSKNTGRLIHISNFILETTGQLKLSDEEFNKSQHDASTKPESADAATIIYPGSNGDNWWDMEQLCHQVLQKAIPIFELLHPHSQAVFVFDCSSAHDAYAKTALRVQNMNLSPGGKQSLLRDSVIPTDDPCIPTHLRGLPQTFFYNASHPNPKLAGKAKGVQAIFEERGLWQHYSAKAKQEKKPSLNLRCSICAASNIQKDVIERSARLVRQAEESGYFLPHKQSLSEIDVPDDSHNEIINQIPTQSNTKTCCWSMILSCQSDFTNERPLLQAIIEDAGHLNDSQKMESRLPTPAIPKFWESNPQNL
ncbi:uncharacterized protein PGTG_00272 [Puccinia graminis f. sp. tritici CRL 75-36-700-3]|uniref:DDE-1 domain-containing protein n=1 Tax=Puccinia graminis f. sp. tritici (strain CRL 75-36-700-3 / race SCCL) TaxID=418459 RepID=E3JQY3_PUCGT|nr:uncharacterized protein PGTG_00272 [Puccinia graminis f. sp. tritici CRL 75-36-700-3]EFP74316.1 hypothetical protein PGTG_00272 [Puccinia graminis f. sp. tritici CRL 75-36-700-3]